MKLCDTTQVSTTRNISDSFHALFFTNFGHCVLRNFFTIVNALLNFTLSCVTMFGVMTDSLRSNAVGEDSMRLKN